MTATVTGSITPGLPGVRRNIFLFPLGTVLFPGGLLPLKIFEQRYLDMTKACLRDNVPFGVCLIREGHEVGTPAVHESVGCMAYIEQWDMPNPGMFHLLARGSERFRVLETSVPANGLISAEVEILPDAESSSPPPELVVLLKRVIDEVGAAHFATPLMLDDGAWVAYRITEIVTWPMLTKQRMLESNATTEIFSEIEKSIKTNS